MAAEKKPGTQPNGNQRDQKSQQKDDKKLREDAKADTTGDSPMDPQDESFIESK
jgi:hypothetical protein